MTTGQAICYHHCLNRYRYRNHHREGTMSKAQIKLPPMKKAKSAPAAKMPKGEAKPLTQAPKPKIKLYERSAKPSEQDRLERSKEMATRYIIQRDDMDPDTAAMVIAGMEPFEVFDLVQEANSAVMERVPTGPVAAPEAPAAAPAEAPVNAMGALLPDPAGAAAEEEELPAVDFLTIPHLAAHETFSDLVVECADAAKKKNTAEKLYKSNKLIIIGILKDAKVDRVECVGIKLAVYTGHSVQLDPHLLLQAGVSADIIKRCYKDSPYTDVRVTSPKG